jgi:hypothetical protein
MSYGRGMGLILRPPTRTWGFRGLRFLYQPPVPRMPRAGLRRLGRLGDSGYSDPTTGEWIDTTNSPMTNAPAGVVTPDSIQVPQFYTAPSMLTPADTVPVGQNYNPAIAALFNASPLQAAQMAINSAILPANALTAPQIAAAPYLSSTTLLLGGAGILALFMFAGKKRGR